jgi:hypothetical protein
MKKIMKLSSLFRSGFFALFAISLAPSSANAVFRNSYVNFNLGVGFQNKILTPVFKKASSSGNSEYEEMMRELENFSGEKRTNDIVKGKKKAGLCGDFRIGYDFNFAPLTLGGFIGVGFGGGKEIATFTAQSVQSRYVVKTSYYIPIGIRVGYQLSAETRAFLSFGYAPIVLKNIHKNSSTRVRTGSFFTGVGLETPLNASNNLLFTVNFEVYIASGKKIKKLLQDADKVSRSVQQRVTFGLTYRF